MAISKKDIEHIANLARIKLSGEEKKKFSHQLSSILEYVEKINELELSQGQSAKDSQIKGQAKKITDARLDQVEEFNNPENLIKQAPKLKNNLVQTKSVFQ